ncbi:MAG: alanine racemase [Acidaminococcaceae bacterium]|nr:alanine racemase [Acidaminococcaceae bacterium]MBQ5345385.1 alanine racemase [Acidaminococcaceae bacterium]
MQIDRGTRAEVNLDAIANNIQVARKNLKDSTMLCAVVKANGYGHGAVPVAKACLEAGADWLAVAILQEAVELREAGITAPILVLGAMPARRDLADICVKFDISHAVFDEERLLLLNEAGLRQGKKAKIHIALDTGMHRIGVKIEEAGAFALKAKALQGIEIQGVFSHFSDADAEDKGYAAFQFEQYAKGAAAIEGAGVKIPIRHICNSAGIAELPQYQMDMVRLGISLYGPPASDAKEAYKDYRPAMVFKTQVAYVKSLPAGRDISYGRLFTTNKESVIATIPVGYADGVSRHLSNKGYVVVRGKKAPVAGRVCMDQLMVDVTDIPGVQIGDDVIIYGGPELPTEEVAAIAGTIPYELFCTLSPRVPRVYVRD